MVLNNRSKLKGTVEVDEVLLGGKKSGKRGKGKPSFSVNVYSGIQEPTRLPNFLDSFKRYQRNKKYS